MRGWYVQWVGLLSKQSSRSLWLEEAGRAGLRDTPVSQGEDGAVSIKALWSGISRGTERLVFEGKIPESEYQTMRCPYQEGAFPFPVKYGYALVGEPLGDKEETKRAPVFVLHPHQEFISVRGNDVHPLPEGLPPRRAVLAANMETALTATWDSGAGPGDRVLIVGGGVVGLLTAFLCARIPGTEVTLTDIAGERAETAQALGAAFCRPEKAPGDQDVVFHASASDAGLDCALAWVVEMSWYGSRPVSVPLGGAFHSRRLQLISSQVGRIPESRAPRWSHARRMAAALSLLKAPQLDALITGEVAFADLPDRLPAILAPSAPGLMTVVRYD